MISECYTMFSSIPIAEDPDGSLYTDCLWAKDLLLHFDYLQNFRLCCPLVPRTDKSLADTPLPTLRRDQIIALRESRGWWEVLVNLIPNLLIVWRAARTSEILHAGGAGWPFPLAYYLLLLKPILRSRWIMVIESTFWMSAANSRPSWRAALIERLQGALIRRCLQKADIRIFTSDWYRKVLFGRHDNCLIAPAVWIDEAMILPDEDVLPRSSGPLRLILPTRLVPEKGVKTVLEALALYNRADHGLPMEIGIIGSGPLAEQVRSFVSGSTANNPVHFLDPVPYGPEFFKILRDYDAVLIASLTEEQPRIAFDAFSQGLPCVASRTNGNVSVIEEGITGYFFTPGDAESLAGLLARLADAPERLTILRKNALSAAHRNNHQQMHRTRRIFLEAYLRLQDRERGPVTLPTK